MTVTGNASLTARYADLPSELFACPRNVSAQVLSGFLSLSCSARMNISTVAAIVERAISAITSFYLCRSLDVKLR